MTGEAALDGLRVVDLTTGIAGAVATMILADFGADVVRLAAARSEATRTDPGFATWDRNKRAVRVADESGPRLGRLTELLSAADLCVVGRSVGEPFDEDELAVAVRAAGNRGLVTLEVPPFLGSTTPWAGGRESGELLSAYVGIAERQSSATPGPVDPVFPYLLYEQGVWAATCAVAALLERRASGHGQTVTVGGAHGAAVAGYVTYLVEPHQPAETPPVGPGGRNPCYTRYQCANGEWLFLGALTPKFKVPAFATLGLSDLLADPRIGGDPDATLLPDNREWVRDRMAAAFRSRVREEWVRLFDQAGVPVGRFMSRDAWLDHPQIRAVGMRAEVDDPRRGRVVMPGVPLVLTKTPGTVRTPAVEATTDAAGWPARPADAVIATAARRTGGPLEGLRVLDVGTILAGPMAGNLLAELGADVVKVEPPGGDPFRVAGFHYNRGMRSIGIDLRSAGGRAVFYDLVKTADVVIDNYRPGVLGRLEIDYVRLARIKPDIVCLSATGFGEGGPLAEMAGFDPILQAMSGMMSAQGGDGEPVFLTQAVNDVTAAAMMALGACLGVYHRDVHGGGGQRAWTSLAGIAAFMQLGEVTRFAGRPPGRVGGTDVKGTGPLDRHYATADGGWVRLQASADAVPLLRKAGLLDENEPGDVTERALAAGFAGRGRDEVIARLTGLGVPIAASRTMLEYASDEEVRAFEVLQPHVRADGEPYLLAGRLARFGRTQRTGVLVAPGLGEHARAILHEAGYDDARIDQAVEAGVVVEGEPMRIEGFVSYR